MKDASSEAWTEQLAAAVRTLRERLERAANGGAEEADTVAVVADPLPIEILARQFSLSRFEREVLLLCLSWELDTRVAPLCAAIQNDPRKAHPTFGLALSLSSDPVWDALSPGGALRHWQLIDLQATLDQPVTAWALRADERILSFVKGVHHLDARLAPLLERMHAPERELAPSQREVVERMVERFRGAVARGRLPVIQLSGRDRDLCVQAAVTVAATLGLLAYRLDAAQLPGNAAELDLWLRLWERETLLSPAALLIDAFGVEGSTAAIERFAARCPGLLLVAARDRREVPGRSTLHGEIARANAEERRQAWSEQLPGQSAELSARLADQFVLDISEIAELVSSVPAAKSGDFDTLWVACRDAAVPRLDGLARRIEPRASWDELVLAPEELRTLHDMAAQLRHRTRVYEHWGFAHGNQRGLALTALFAGESGTGKTLAAEVLASELHVPLLCVDLSAVIDKYIGETEKNLRRVFDAAEDAAALLFFDEADALFGKRSEVKQAHDRFANIEINYLLQRMESYRGLAVLATNLKSALDVAFMRRLRFHVRFAFPAERERRALWRRIFPAQTPLAALDYDQLGAFALTGASIRNIAMNAAFSAADRDSQVTMPLVLDAVRSEMRKLDQRLNEHQFRDAASALPHIRGGGLR